MINSKIFNLLKENKKENLLEIAKMYENGIEVNKSIYESLRFYEQYDSNLIIDLYNENKSINTKESLYLIGCILLNNNEDKESIPYFKKAIELGSTEALVTLGTCYYNGEGVRKSYKKAFELYEKATLENYPIAFTMLATCYYFGRSVKQDKDKAIELYEHSAKLNCDEAMFRLSDIYLMKEENEKALHYATLAASLGNIEAIDYLGYFNLKGISVKQDTTTAINYFEIASNYLLSSKMTLANIYYFGEGIESDYNKAFKLYNELYEEDYEDAYKNVGVCYREGRGVEQDYKKSFEIFYHYADNYGDEFSICEVGNAYFNGCGVEENYKEAIRWFEIANKNFDYHATAMLGLSHIYGYGVEVDYDKALEYYLSISYHNILLHKEMIAICYYKKEDYKEALKWCEICLDEGSTSIMFLIGKIYLLGLGVEENKELALEYLEAAVDNNNTSAMIVLAECYFNGIILPQNYSLSAKYYELILEQDEFYEHENINELIKLGHISKKYKC